MGGPKRLLLLGAEAAYCLGQCVQHEIMKLMEAIGFKCYSRHGLRKNAVNNLLEAGCTTQETAAISGQTERMVAHHARRVNQKRLAERAIRKLPRHGTGTDSAKPAAKPAGGKPGRR